jgi:succinate dehydrogenase/fumarate reductase iron-sulfur protein
MPQKIVKVKVFRFDPSVDEEPHYRTYKVPLAERMSVLDVLDYIYENLDGSLAYYDHAACRHGVCSGCSMMVNGKPTLACQTVVLSDITVEPIPKFQVIKDLVYTKRRE